MKLLSRIEKLLSALRTIRLSKRIWALSTGYTPDTRLNRFSIRCDPVKLSLNSEDWNSEAAVSVTISVFFKQGLLGFVRRRYDLVLENSNGGRSFVKDLSVFTPIWASRYARGAQISPSLWSLEGMEAAAKQAEGEKDP